MTCYYSSATVIGRHNDRFKVEIAILTITRVMSPFGYHLQLMEIFTRLLLSEQFVNDDVKVADVLIGFEEYL